MAFSANILSKKINAFAIINMATMNIILQWSHSVRLMDVIVNAFNIYHISISSAYVNTHLRIMIQQVKSVDYVQNVINFWPVGLVNVGLNFIYIQPKSWKNGIKN